MTDSERKLLNIELTLLNEFTRDGIVQGCKLAQTLDCTTVCVFPFWIPLVMQVLRNTTVHIATPIGLPYGGATAAVKVYEAQRAIVDGASELEVMINVGALKSGHLHVVRGELTAITRVAHAQSGAQGYVKITAVLPLIELQVNELQSLCKLLQITRTPSIQIGTGIEPKPVSLDTIQLVRQFAGAEMLVKVAVGEMDAEVARKLLDAGATSICMPPSAAMMLTD
ncbi:MAG TPA: hypothetical protein EYP10_13230 [Armatimonadetes bacterium]|nr:hypothetical protein [Armatimonadota bacterium]